MPDDALRPHLDHRTWATLTRAEKFCTRLIENATNILHREIANRAMPAVDVCFAVVGPVGRMEALPGAEVELIPVLRTQEAFDRYQPHDRSVRQMLRDGLGLKVTAGDDLTSPANAEEMTAAASIGGDKDSSAALAKRILLLTEGRQAGGGYPLADLRRAVLQAYIAADRAGGRHVWSFCDDVCRYYRTLCVESRARADDPVKDWCGRHMTLRHGRKLWYFSLVFAAVAVGDSPLSDDEYVRRLLEEFDRPPYVRLFRAVSAAQRGQVGRILEPFGWFLDFMSEPARRDALAKVEHATRQRLDLQNPFHAVQFNAERMQQEMVTLIESQEAHVRQRLFGRFLL
jgi:hypothetical protein